MDNLNLLLIIKPSFPLEGTVVYTYRQNSNSSLCHSRGNNRSCHILECNRHRFLRTLLCTFLLGLYPWNHSFRVSTSDWQADRMDRSFELTDTRQRDWASRIRKLRAGNLNQSPWKIQKGKLTETASYFQQWYQVFLCDLTRRQEMEVSEVLTLRLSIWTFSLDSFHFRLTFMFNFVILAKIQSAF